MGEGKRMIEEIDLKKLLQGINSELYAFHYRLNELEKRMREMEIMFEHLVDYLCERE